MIPGILSDREQRALRVIASLALVVISSLTTLTSAARTLVLRNWGGVRVIQQNDQIRIDITTENQSRIAAIAVDDSDARVRLAAVRKLIDQQVLAQVVQKDPDLNVRLAALERVTDENLLESIERAVSEADIRASAARRLASAEDLNLLMRDPAPRVRAAAVEQASRQDLISAAATNDPSPEVRVPAVRKLANLNVVGEIARTDPSARVRMEAVERLSDQTRLSEAVVKDPSPEVRAAATLRLTDADLLDRLAFTSRPDSRANRPTPGCVDHYRDPSSGTWRSFFKAESRAGRSRARHTSAARLPGLSRVAIGGNTY